MNVVKQIAGELAARETQVEAAVALLDQGSTVPFIARYRKEATGGLDDTQLRQLEERLRYLRELEERRAVILRSLEERGELEPELEAAIRAADTKTRLEDLYLPFRPKRRTKGQIAKEAGLEPLADRILANPSIDLEAAAAEYVNEERGVADAAAALEGARSILAERFAEDPELTGELRELVWNEYRLTAKVIAGKEKEGAKFSDYYDYSEPLRKIPSHRALALLRGRSSGILRLGLAPVEPVEEAPSSPAAETDGKSQETPEKERKRPFSRTEARVASRFGVRDEGRAGDRWLLDTVRDAWSVKLLPRLETDLVLRVREAAEDEAIRVFSANLHDLLLAAPAGPRVTIGLDPGIRTGVKVAVIDATGKLLDHGTIWPHAPRNDREGAIATLAELARKHNAEIVAIGNGTASRETDRLVKELLQRHTDLKLEKLVVNEAGASVYSASELGAKEFPDLDVSFRGAVSIARRLQDPLAELVKIEPRSIGVGQYQHDVNQTKLARSLDAVVEDCVNAVGVDVNTASTPLLARVSGLNRGLAENIVVYRDEHGAFRKRADLMEVPRMGEKSFEQSAGFLRIMNGDDPLDSSAVHPESYPVVGRIVERTGRSVRELLNDSAFLRTLDPSDFVDESYGLPTVSDILRELEKPGRDPRPSFVTASFADGIETIADLKPEMIVEGVVTNVTNFGAFVDIGVHQDGLIHISRLSNRFVRDPREVVKPGDVVKVRVVEVDPERKRVGLSLRLDANEENGEDAGARGGSRSERRGRRPRRRGGERERSTANAASPGAAGAQPQGGKPAGSAGGAPPRGRRGGQDHRRGERGPRRPERDRPAGGGSQRPGSPRPERQTSGPTLFGKLLDQALEEARRRDAGD